MPKVLHILLIGRLDKDIGIANYVRAIKALKERRIKFELAVCGDGPLRNEVEKYGEVYGFVDDLSTHLANTDFVFTSSYLTIFDAFLYKKLVFATYDNLLKEDYLKMTPFEKWMVIEKDPKTMAEKILYYVDNPKEKDSLTKDAYTWVKRQSWESIADVYIELWKNQV